MSYSPEMLPNLNQSNSYHQSSREEVCLIRVKYKNYNTRTVKKKTDLGNLLERKKKKQLESVLRK